MNTIVSDTSARSELIALLRREGQYSGVWFGDKLIEAADILASLPSLSGEWEPIETAPKDGKLLELVVDYSSDDADHPLQDAILACTIGFNGLEDTGEDEWKFAGWCWSHDHFTEGKGTPVAWRPSRLNACDAELPPLPAPPAMLSATPSFDGERSHG